MVLRLPDYPMLPSAPSTQKEAFPPVMSIPQAKAPESTPRCTITPLPSLGGEKRSYRGLLQPFVSHAHDCYVIGRVLRGLRSLRLNDRLVQIGPGDVVVFNPGDVHGCDQLDETPFAYDSVTVAADVFDGARLRCPAGNDVAVVSAVGALMAAAGSGEPDDLVAERAMVLAGLLQMASEFESDRAVPCLSHEVSVLRTYEYLRLHLADPVNLGVLAAMEGLSPYALIRAYRRRSSITPLQHLTSMRIERACGLLAGGAVPSEVAAQTGFCDQAHLTRMFKQRMGVTPAAYGKMAELGRAAGHAAARAKEAAGCV